MVRFDSFASAASSVRIAGLGVLGAIAFAASAPAAERASGTIYDSVEAAASAGLAEASAKARGSRHEWGGTVYRVDGGYGYSAPKRGGPTGVPIQLGEQDVAWFYAHGERAAHAASRVSQTDRMMVDRKDPQRRPLFVQSPDQAPIVYRDGQLTTLDGASLQQRLQRED